MHLLSETNILIFLIQLFVLTLCTRGLGELFTRWNQPALTAEILVGIILGPTLFGRYFPELHGMLFPADVTQQNMLETVAWIGVLFLLLDTGLEIDFSVAWRHRGNALVIALAHIIIPMLIAFLPCYFLPDHFLPNPDRRLLFALFMAAVMAICAMPVAARVLHDLKLLKTDLGFLTMSALAVNDLIGWMLFTIILGLYTKNSFSPGPIIGVVLTTVCFTAMTLRFGRSLSTRILAYFNKQKLPEPATSLTFACLLGLLFGSITQRLGIHALFGFFLAGVVIGEAKNLSEDSRRIISQMVHALFVPIFFANIGLKIDFVGNFNVGLVLLVSAIGVAGRYLGAWLGVSLTNVPRMNRDLISILQTPGGMMEIVVALLALESGLITQEVFVAIVFSAVLSSIMVGPWLRVAMKRRSAVSLLDYITPDCIRVDLNAAGRHEVIRTLAALAARRTAGITPEQMTASALAREEEFGTAVGDGLAIPHVRLEGIIHPVLAFGRIPGGVDWDAPDGQPVRNVFFLATPSGTQDIHVQMLSKIAKIMQAPQSVRLMERARNADELWKEMTRLFSAPPAKPSEKAA